MYDAEDRMRVVRPSGDVDGKYYLKATSVKCSANMRWAMLNKVGPVWVIGWRGKVAASNSGSTTSATPLTRGTPG